MKIVFALKNRIVHRLWGALILSCIGAEIYSFAIVWIATDRFGSNAGYLIALLATPKLIHACGLSFVQVLAAVLYLGFGVTGICIAREIQSTSVESSPI